MVILNKLVVVVVVLDGDNYKCFFGSCGFLRNPHNIAFQINTKVVHSFKLIKIYLARVHSYW